MLKKSAYSQKFIESALTQPMKSGLIRSVARIAQSVEQGIENPRVLGSIPSPGTTSLLTDVNRRLFSFVKPANFNTLLSFNSTLSIINFIVRVLFKSTRYCTHIPLRKLTITVTDICDIASVMSLGKN